MSALFCFPGPPPLGYSERFLSKARPSHPGLGPQRRRLDSAQPGRLINGGCWSLKSRGGYKYSGRRHSRTGTSPFQSSLRSESKAQTRTSARSVAAGVGVGITPQLKRTARKMPPGWQTEVPSPPRVPARGRRAPGGGRFAQDKGEGGGCLQRASYHALTGNS